jgi:GT2 family glycosyltransferase
LKASVIVVVHAGEKHLQDSVESLAPGGERGRYEVVVVDNGSADRCGERAAERYPWAKVVRADRNLGFAGGVHLGVEASSGDVLILLNDDASAEVGFVEAHLETLDANPGAAASAGRLLDLTGARHDFLRGGVTFDCHAFQIGQGFSVHSLAPTEQGEELPFACGGNMAVRRTDWEASGGFDRELFAYFEDVELGWRLWAMGRRVVAAPDAVARHRGAATSSMLGDFRRGVLFERNALRAFVATADTDCRGAFAPAIATTFLHRLAEFAKDSPEFEHATADPFAEGHQVLSFGERWRRRLRRRGLAGTLRHLAARGLLGPRAGQPVLEDGRLLMQLRAAQGFVGGLDHVEERRSQLEAMRTVPDREILARFPRMVVPTYPGDERLFQSDAFQSLLPVGWPLEFRELDELMRG